MIGNWAETGSKAEAKQWQITGFMMKARSDSNTVCMTHEVGAAAWYRAGDYSTCTCGCSAASTVKNHSLTNPCLVGQANRTAPMSLAH